MNNKCPADIAVENPFGVMFLRPVEGVEYEMKDTDDEPSFEQSLDQALDEGRMDLVAQWSKHI